MRYLSVGRYFLNDQPADEVHLRQLLLEATKRRIEKLVWIAADESVTYGEVAAIVSELQSDTPDLHIALATEPQIGPVEPSEVSRMGGERADGTNSGMMPCLACYPKL